MMKGAEARQATIGQMQPKVYLPDLLKNRSHDFVRACHRLMLMPRETGESAFPDLATFVTVTKRVAGGRTSQAQQERRRENEIAEKLDRKDHSEDDTHVRNIY